jgi:hypothetical protein
VDIFIALLAPKELVGANAIAGAMNPRVARVVNFILINWIFERLLQKDRQVCENGESKTMLSSLFLHPEGSSPSYVFSMYVSFVSA